ncbi:hypothetical protein EJ110_NYTH01684 [Nymphaea thermarum]|nr:hypothetical protein EJ110_NYTH01684 [Nymphaea thermarum]
MEGCKFSGGTAKANLILSTGILQRAWTAVSELQQSGDHQLPFIVNDQLDLHLLPPFLAPLQPTHPDFGFLITKDNPSISLHASPLSTFLRLLRTTDLKAQLQRSTEKNKPQLILVGRSLGGSVAALCTLWLLKNQSSPSLPLCVTFGSPLTGDDGLRKAIDAVEQWKAQFWHVAGHDDIIPRLFASRQTGQNSGSQCKPFGTYFLISDSGCTCVDDPDSVLELLDLTSPSLDELPMQLRPRNYGVLLKQLEKKPLCRSRNIAAARFQESLTVDLALQLDSVGIGSNHLVRKASFFFVDSPFNQNDLMAS